MFSLVSLSIQAACAVTVTEPLTSNPNFASGVVIKQNGNDLTTSSAPGNAQFVSGNIYMYCVYTDVVFTFPSAQTITSFSFTAANVGGAQPLRATYKDGTNVDFNIAAAAGISNTTTVVTFTGDGRAIASFRVLGMTGGTCNTQNVALGLDYWIFRTFSWDYQNSVATQISVSIDGQATYRSPVTLNATLGVSGSDGKVYFYANGKVISGCNPVLSRTLGASCTWRPSQRGLVQISTKLKPIDSNYLSSNSASISVVVANRSTKR